MDFILNAITGTLNAMSAVLRGWSWTRNLADDIAEIAPWIQKANMLIPVDAALTVLSLYLAINLALMAYYWVTRTINLIRGAG